jgi:glutamate dehydrogenase/leucine dehydrogenase
MAILKPEQDRLRIDHLISLAAENAANGQDFERLGRIVVAISGAYTISQKTADTFTKEGGRIIGVASTKDDAPRTNER